MQNSKYSYPESGVDYSKIDPLKIMAQEAARETAKNLSLTGFKEVQESRGESAYVMDMGDFYLASITECLGTKSLVADEMRKITGKTYYDQIAQDTIASAVNDIVTVGARPLSIHAYWAVGSSEWFDDEKRMKDLVHGWKKTCDKIKVAWGGGETPSLSGIIQGGAIDLAASCVGIVKPKERLTLGDHLQEQDAIIFLESSGIHANGMTLARKIVDCLKEGYQSRLPDGRPYGEALLDPTILYSPVIEALFQEGIRIHYLSNITGHGWRKIMRHPDPFTYRITALPPVPPVLQFIVEKSGLDLKEAYGIFNMGAGFVVFVSEKDMDKTIKISYKNGIKAFKAGQLESGEKKVLIDPLKIVFESKSLNLRPHAL